MKKSNFSEEQILSILSEAEDKPVVEVCRLRNVSTATFYTWKARYAGLTGSELKEKRTADQENARLKRLLAELLLDNSILKEAVVRLERLGKR
jgi:putative transposase